mgnify:FL=1
MRAFIPTPSVSYIPIGPLRVHFYALCIIAGIFIAIGIGRKRYSKNPELISELAIYAVPAGVIGGRFYHVITTPELYFNHNFLDAFRIWDGGMGIWGAIFFGALAVIYRLHRKDLLSEFFNIGDALVPGLLFAQAVGRFGNWFNGELFGKPTSLPWALEIPISNRPIGFENYQTFHPTFLYEAIWCLLVGGYLLRQKIKFRGQIFWSYIWLYSLGRLLVESIRIEIGRAHV